MRNSLKSRAYTTIPKHNNTGYKNKHTSNRHHYRLHSICVNISHRSARKNIKNNNGLNQDDPRLIGNAKQIFKYPGSSHKLSSNIKYIEKQNEPCSDTQNIAVIKISQPIWKG